jgi:ankyrin repeat protein
MSGAVLRDACKIGDLFNIDRILAGSLNFSLMRSPIFTGVQSVKRKSTQEIMNDRDQYGQGALHICIKELQVEALKRLLVVPGLDLNAGGMGNYSPAVLACTKNSGVCLALLLEHGVDPNQVDDTQWTLLHHCCAVDGDRALDTLLKRRDVLVDQTNDGGYTPLMMACVKNSCEMIERLVGAGADPLRKHFRTQESSYDMVVSAEARNAIISGLSRNQARLAELAVLEEERLILERSRSRAAPPLQSLDQDEHVQLDQKEEV